MPILQSRIDAEKVSVWNPTDSSVLRALWLDNTSNLTLDGGSFNVLEGDAFAGEGLMDAIKPGEKRLLSYAADQGILVDSKQKAENQRVTKIVIAHGTMTQIHTGAAGEYATRSATAMSTSGQSGDRTSRAAGMETHRRRKAGGEFGFLSSLPDHAGSKENHDAGRQGIPADW